MGEAGFFGSGRAADPFLRQGKPEGLPVHEPEILAHKIPTRNCGVWGTRGGDGMGEVGFAKSDNAYKLWL